MEVLKLVEVQILEFGYSLEKGRHFIRFLVSGLKDEDIEKIVGIVGQIPEGSFKRFQTWNTDTGLEIYELFPAKEYPFNKEIPSPEEFKAVEKNVQGFLARFN
jgi:hypothetical protein